MFDQRLSGEQRRTAIVKAALPLFARKGFANTTTRELAEAAGVSEALNYGLDQVRFLAPVKVGARIRDRVVLLAVETKDKSRILLKTRNTIEIEGETRPALIAETLSLLLLDA